MLKGLSFVVFVTFGIHLFGQTVPSPVPCTAPPSGPGCECSSAGILCTPDLFDGFTFSMSNAVNYGGFGFGNDLCPGIGNQDGVPNNVNWFSFIAWCTDLTFDVYISNCSAGTQGGGAPSYGVQMGLFAGCPISNPLECITEGTGLCSDNPTGFVSPRTFSVNGLTVGNTYYFMMDGCKGSACDITIDVIGSCGTGEIDPWSTPVMGPLTTCVGNTDTYTVEDLDGAVEYYYYLDGVLIDDGTELYSTDITWSTPGTYQLCVDVANLPCIPESDDPAPNCITIMVCDEAEAGTLSINTSPACPDEIINFSVSGNTSGPDHDQYLIITDNTGNIIEIILGTTGSFTHDECETFKLFSYNVKTGAPAPTVGTTFPDDYPCMDNCCDYEEDLLEFEDTVPPVFTNPPADITFDCYADLPPMPDLDWTDDCAGSGMKSGIENGTADLCNGGSLTRRWEVADSCDNVASHVQNITIDPVPQATYMNPPADVTIDCDAIPTGAPDLSFSNTGSGACEIMGTVSPVISGMADLCGGTITNEWMTTDLCGRPLNHTQTITVNPVPAPTFNNPPADMTVQCDAIPTSAPDLSYSNGETGACEIAGTISPTMSGTGDQCGGNIIFTWDFTDQCGNNINHVQTITIDPIPQASFVNPPADMTVQCDAIPTSAPDLMYTNNQSGVCEISGTVAPVMSGTGDICGGNIQFMWEFVDVCGRTISHTQTITIDPIPPATFVNPPADVSVPCSATPTSAPDLMYTNNQSGVCEIAGTISPTVVDNSSECGGNIVYTWEFTDQCNRPIMHTQTITIDPAPPATYMNPPADITVDCDAIPGSAPDLMLSNGETEACQIEATVAAVQNGTPSPCGGTIQFQWNYTDNCNRPVNHVQNVTINPAAPPVFDAPPADITVDCNAVPPSGIPLNYSNSETGVCAISGTINSSRTGVVNECGGSLLDTWNYTDDCGRTISTFRTITVNPAPEAMYVNPPSDITINCDEVGSLDLNASYSNGQSNNCLIEGDVTAITTNNYDVCGGTITHTWTFTDACNRTILHNRTVTINPAPDPTFVNPPADLTVDCGESYDPPFTIEVSNGLTGNCEIIDQATIITTWNGNVMSNEWSYTSPCSGVTITHYQDVLTLTEPDISINPTFGNLCEGDAYDLSTIFVTDANNTNPTYTYHFALPPSPFNEIDPLVEPIGLSLYYIVATTADGCTDDAEFIIYTVEPYLAGEDAEIELCKDGSTLNLNDYLSSDASEEGFWFDLDATGIDVNDPENVNINNVNPGSYFLYYITDENEECPGDTAVLTLTITDEVIYTIDDVSCSADNSSYTIVVTTNGNTVTSSGGTLNVIDANTVEITDILIGTQITLTISNSSGCSTERIINSPNCDCPDINPPSGTPTYKICGTDVPLQLEVMVENGLSANWYDTQAGLTPLLANSLTYEHTNANPGIYTYFVESIDPNTLCVSQERFEIEVQVVAKPTALNINPMICDDDTDGIQQFDLSVIGADVNGNPNNTITFYPTMADAIGGTNALVSPYTNTSSDQVIFAVVENPTGCQAVAEITLSVLPLPEVSLNINDESCLEQEDGSVQVTTINSNGELSYAINNGPFGNTSTFDSLPPANYQLAVVDTAGCSIETTFMIGEGLQLNTITFEVICDNKGTLSDASDDEYTMNFNFGNNLGNQGRYIVLIDNIEIGRFNYDELQNYILPADGSNKQVTIIDENNECELIRSIGPLNPCSTTCILSVDDISFVCNNNGTDDNPGDDFYEVNVLVSSINGSSANTYNLLVDGTIRGVGNYDEYYTFNVNSSSVDIVLTFQDSEDNQCQTTYTLTDLVPCSDGCAVIMTIIDQLCDNNGTLLDKNDDFYTIRFVTRAINTGSNTYQLLIDGSGQNTYNYDDTISITLPADGIIHTLSAEDENRSDCFDEVETRILTNCSTDCEITVTTNSVLCDNNETNDNELDDTYTFELTITGGKANEWRIDDLGLSGAYGTTIQLGPYNISDGPVDITIVDGDIAECSTVQTILPPMPCSGCVQTMSIMANGIINCNNPEVELEAMVSEQGIYQWTFEGGNVSNGLTGTAGSEGYYVFTAIFTDGCSLVDSVFVESDDDIPVANAGADLTLNCEVDSVKLDGINSSQGPDYRYEWTDENGTVIGTDIDLWVYEPGEYFLQVFDINFNCASAKEKVVVSEFIDVPSTAIYANPGDQFDCIIAEIILSTDNEPNVMYSWITPEFTFDNVDSISVTQIGEYILVATNTQSLCVDTGSIEIVSFQEYPIIELNVDGELDCDSESVSISSEGSQQAPSITYNWYNSDGELISQSQDGLEAQEPGFYILVLEDEDNGCTNSDSVEVISVETEVGIDIETFIEVIQGERVVLRPVINIPEDEIASIQWTPTEGLSCTDCLEPTVIIDEDASYTITVIDIYGCVGSATVNLRAKIKTVITVPNVINPESGSGNDKFIIWTNDDLAVINRVLIYDRWGNKVYSSESVVPNSPEGAWDGRFNGKDVVPGVFVYLIEGVLSTGEVINLSGDITVMR